VGSHLAVVGDESFQVSAVFLEVVVDALEVEQFPDDHCVDGLDVTVEFVRDRWQDEQSQADLLAGGLEGSAELGAAVDLYLLDVDIVADLAEQVGRAGRAGRRVDAIQTRSWPDRRQDGDPKRTAPTAGSPQPAGPGPSATRSSPRGSV